MRENSKPKTYAIGMFVNRSFQGLSGDNQNPIKIRIPPYPFLYLFGSNIFNMIILSNIFCRQKILFPSFSIPTQANKLCLLSLNRLHIITTPKMECLQNKAGEKFSAVMILSNNEKKTEDTCTWQYFNMGVLAFCSCCSR